MSLDGEGASEEPRRKKGKNKNLDKPWEDDSVDHWKEEPWQQVKPSPLERPSCACSLSYVCDVVCAREACAVAGVPMRLLGGAGRHEAAAA